MNFFEQQDIARRNTKRLVFLLLLAVLSLITITVLFVAVMLTYFQGTSGYANESLGFGQKLLNSISWELLAWISLIVGTDRKSTRLKSSHVKISYAVFCLKNK